MEGSRFQELMRIDSLQMLRERLVVDQITY
jgi:hypothetical protein